ncbi:hypothetical protein FisN_7Hu383 [Fistulifera solaris]|uniref:Uncharacterized protein n=1 Tax=Fistulifera solaris TaxID=1519565 RepID=A0A1Z5KSE8_FISSO|nr:hypothetical protein FisN_7Hu383 [Fistulifera solaris]|eukprot:GAX29025.1 hypothetical protein FisN_7Hu383 [Fistulifera solaris]
MGGPMCSYMLSLIESSPMAFIVSIVKELRRADAERLPEPNVFEEFSLISIVACVESSLTASFVVLRRARLVRNEPLCESLFAFASKMAHRSASKLRLRRRLDMLCCG